MLQGKKLLLAFIPSLAWPWTQAGKNTVSELGRQPTGEHWDTVTTSLLPEFCSLLSSAASGRAQTETLLSEVTEEQEACLWHPGNFKGESQQGQRKDSAMSAHDRGNSPLEQSGLSHGSQEETHHSYQINPSFPLDFTEWGINGVSSF